MHSQFGVSPQVSSDAIGQRETHLGQASSRLAFLVLRLALLAIHFSLFNSVSWQQHHGLVYA